MAALLLASGCSDEPADTASGEDAGGQPDSHAIVSTREIEGVGTVLVDADGLTLYTTEAETDGSVKCVDGCTDFWPPLTVEEDAVAESIDGISGEFGIVTRPDGSGQLALDGFPLYTFAEDQGPGTAVGDGFEDDFQGTHFVWHAATVVGPAPGGDTDDTDDSGDDDGGYDYGY